MIKLDDPNLSFWIHGNEKYRNLKPYKISIFIDNQFTPLFALTPGTDKIQLAMSTETLETVYRLSIPYKKLGDYTKVTVKFMQEGELLKLLENSYAVD